MLSKRILRIFALIQALFSIFTCQAKAVSTSASSAILVDADSGRVLYEQNADAKMLIASTTKIMTALVAIREGDLSDTVTVSRAAAYTEGSAMYLSVGEELTLETLLYGVMLCSGNDAAVAVAEHVGGSVEGFVGMMNETAKELGLTSTSFANPNGLDHQDHYSTARDMAALAAEAMKNATFRRIVSTRSVTIGGRTMTNHNKLLSMAEGCIGLKTGYTRAAGRTLVSCAERKGRQLIAVTLQDGNDWADHQALFDYGFSAFSHHRALTRGTVVRKVESGQGEMVPLVAAESFSYPLAEGETLECRVELPRSISVSTGAKVGQAVYLLNGREIGRADLLCGKSERVSNAWSILKMKDQG